VQRCGAEVIVCKSRDVGEGWRFGDGGRLGDKTRYRLIKKLNKVKVRLFFISKQISLVNY
jgi:hypothetical protein